MFEFLRDCRGSVALIAGISALPLLVVCGIAVDYSVARLTRTKLQAASDVAALTAASSVGTLQQREDIATTMFAHQMREQGSLFDEDPQVVVTIKGDSAEAVAQVQQKTLLLHLIGIDENPVRTRSKSLRRPGKPICMLALDPVSSDAVALTGTPRLAAEDCVVQSNSTATDAMHVQGAASAEAAQFCGVGAFASKHNGFDPPAVGGCPKIEDPLAKLPKPGSLSCSGFPSSYSKGTHNLEQGVYCGGLEARTHAELDLAPGIYVIRDGKLIVQAGAKITGTGVIFYLIGDNAGLDLRGGGSMDVSAPTTGPYRGIAIAQDPDSNPGGTSIITGGGDVRFVGTLHMPTQILSLQGNGEIGADSPAWSMIASRFSLMGTAEIHIKSDFMATGHGEPRVRSFDNVFLTQ